MTALEEIKKALEAAEQFIVNGVELGYIRMPNPETPDSAHDTLPMIRQAQTALERLQSEIEHLSADVKREAELATHMANDCNDAQARAEAAERDRDEWKRLHDAAQRTVADRNSALNAVFAQNEALRKLLQPFAAEAENWHDSVPDDHRTLCTEPNSTTAHPGSEADFTVGDLRRARTALASTGGEHHAE